MAEDRKPNWSKWRLMRAVNLWQAVALSLDIDPDKVNHDYNWKAEADFFDESQEFIDRLEVLKDNVGSSALLQPVSMSLADPFGHKLRLRDFAGWARQVEWSIPSELAQLISSAKQLDDDPQLAATWIAKQLWSLAEAAFLLDDKIPPAIAPKLDALGAYPGVCNIYNDIKDAIDLGRLQFFESRTNEFVTRHVEPRACVRWAIALPMQVPQALISKLGRESESVAPPSIESTTPSPVGAISPRELGTLYRLILGMAVAAYNYRVDNNNGAAAGIEKDLQTLDLAVSDDTVRKWLLKAADHLDYKDRKPN